MIKQTEDVELAEGREYEHETTVNLLALWWGVVEWGK